MLRYKAGYLLKWATKVQIRKFKKSHISVDCLGEELEKVLKDYKKKGKYVITADSSSPDLINLLKKYD